MCDVQIFHFSKSGLCKWGEQTKWKGESGKITERDAPYPFDFDVYNSINSVATKVHVSRSNVISIF